MAQFLRNSGAMAGPTKNDIEIDEPSTKLVAGRGLSLEGEIEALRARLEDEVIVSNNLKADIAERDNRIAALERTVSEVGTKVQEQASMIQRIRANYEKDAQKVAVTLEKCDSGVRELISLMDGVEEGVEKMYRSRRWQMANIVVVIKGLFRSRQKQPSRGYWRIDSKLAEYRVWRDRYLGKKD